jgi:hypothetical protein
MVITELRRTGSGIDPTPVVFRWTSDTHSSMTNQLTNKLKVTTMRRMPAGADVPVEQVLSAQWEPFNVDGEWNDKWAGQGFAMSMVREFSQMVGRTQLARFQIDEHSLIGLITDLQTTYYTRDRIGYSFTFSPHANELVGSFQQSANKVPPQPINQRVDTAVDALDSLITASDLADSLPVKNFDIQDSKVQLAEVSSAVDATKAAALGGSSLDPDRSLLALAGTFHRVSGAAQEMMFAVADKRSDVTIAFDDAISILRFDEWRTATMRSAVVAIGTSQDAQVDLRAKASRNPRAIHRVKAGETLERISLRYYGTADNWRAIYDANNLDSIILDGAEVLVIPERTS